MHYQRKSLQWIVTSCRCSVDQADLTGRSPVYDCGSEHSVWTSIRSHLQLLQRHMVGHSLLRTCRLLGHLDLWQRGKCKGLHVQKVISLTPEVNKNVFRSQDVRYFVLSNLQSLWKVKLYINLFIWIKYASIIFMGGHDLFLFLESICLEIYKLTWKYLGHSSKTGLKCWFLVWPINIRQLIRPLFWLSDSFVWLFNRLQAV